METFDAEQAEKELRRLIDATYPPASYPEPALGQWCDGRGAFDPLGPLGAGGGDSWEGTFPWYDFYDALTNARSLTSRRWVVRAYRSAGDLPRSLSVAARSVLWQLLLHGFSEARLAALRDLLFRFMAFLYLNSPQRDETAHLFTIAVNAVPAHLVCRACGLETRTDSIDWRAGSLPPCLSIAERLPLWLDQFGFLKEPPPVEAS